MRHPLAPQQILSHFSRLSPSTEWAFSNAGRSETNYITHGYHRYPAKFIPNIVQKLIQDYTLPGDVVVDPFGGCGTTLVEAMTHGRESYGFDINPVAKLITQTKITPISPKSLERAHQKFLLKFGSTVSTLPDIHYERLEYWFDKNALKELNHIYVAIKSLKNPEIQRFYLCAFSHILKNCSRWLMKSIKPTVDQEKVTVDPLDTFTYHLNFMFKRNKQFYELLEKNGRLGTPCQMRIANSTRQLPLDDESADLIVTSPPYVTSYEYADLHQLSLLWLANDRHAFKKWKHHVQDFNGFRKKFVGTSLSMKRRLGDLNSKIADGIVAKLGEVDTGLANGVRNYYSDMNRSFTEMHRILKRGKKACIIIGNTTLKDVHIANAEVAIEQMQNIGFVAEDFVKREVMNKRITPWRDSKDGRFTAVTNNDGRRVYQYEYVLVMRKVAKAAS